MGRRITMVRKGRLGEDDPAWEAEVWACASGDRRFAEAWVLTEELWRLKGWDPGERGLSRSVARVGRR
jgi:hypothetical protein